MTTNYLLESPAAAPVGSATFVLPKNVPNVFKPRIVFSAKSNTAGTNHNVKATFSYPLATEQNGVWSAQNKFVGSFTFTALQNVISDTERAEAFDEFIAFLQDHKTVIIAGRVK